MNIWHNDYIDEQYRKDLASEAEKIRLANLAQGSRIHRPGIFTRSMFNFSNWMISAGKKLRKRYEAPSVNCNQRPSNSYAR